MQKKQFKNEIIVFIIVIIVLLLIGAFVFTLLEGWSFLDAFYFVSMTSTTVGYGDFTPTHALSKIVTIIYSLSIIPFVLYAFASVAKYHTERIYRTVRGVERKQDAQMQEIERNEKKIAENRKRLKEQETELKKQETILKKQINVDRKLEEEVLEHDKELEVVENIVEGELEREKGRGKKKGK